MEMKLRYKDFQSAWPITKIFVEGLLLLFALYVRLYFSYRGYCRLDEDNCLTICAGDFNRKCIYYFFVPAIEIDCRATGLPIHTMEWE